MRKILVGAAGSGKTSAILKHAWNHADEGVTVCCLPHQRKELLARLAEHPTLDVRVTDLHTLTHEVLELGGNERQFLSIPGRVALLGRLLMGQRQDYPNPGEAALYAGAISELKQLRALHQLDPRSLNPQAQALLGLARAYQQELQVRQLLDLDDARDVAASLLEGGLKWSRGPRHLLIDGYSELTPAEVRLIRALSMSARSLLVTLPGNAPFPFQTRLSRKDIERCASELQATVQELGYRPMPTFTLQVYPNATREARQVVGQVKQALLSGIPARELAIVVPRENLTSNLLKLAEEARIPLMDEHAATPAESFHGRKMMVLLGTRRRNFPTRDLFDLAMFYPGLAQVAEALEARGLGGVHAHLLEGTDLSPLNQLMLDTTPTSGTASEWLAWVDALLDRVGFPVQDRDPLRVLAREVHELIPATPQKHGVLEDWLMALLPAVELPRPPQEGVRVLPPEHILGRRFRKLWVMNATEHQYLLEEKEDFFFTEEERVRLGLPRNMRGIAESLFYEVVTRASEVVLSHASADRDGIQRPHRLLAGLGQPATPSPMPMSPLEYALSTRDIQISASSWWSQVPAIQEVRSWMLARYLPCRLRGYLSNHTEKTQGGLFSRNDRTRLERLLRQSAWENQPLPELQGVWSPQFKAQVEQHLKDNLPPRPDLPGLRVYRDFKLGDLRFRPHAYQLFRDTGKANLYVVTQETDIRTLLKNNPEHLWVFAAFQQAGVETDLYTWDLFAKPRRRSVFENQVQDAWQQLHQLRDHLQKGDVTPTAGFHCWDCNFKQVCRLG